MVIKSNSMSLLILAVIIALQLPFNAFVTCVNADPETLSEQDVIFNELFGIVRNINNVSSSSSDHMADMLQSRDNFEYIEPEPPSQILPNLPQEKDDSLSDRSIDAETRVLVTEPLLTATNSGYEYTFEYIFAGPEEYWYTNLFTLYDYSAGSYVYMSPYGICRGEYTFILEEGHAYNASMYYLDEAGIWTRKDLKIKTPTIASYTSREKDEPPELLVHMVEEVGLYIPIFIVVHHYTNAFERYDVNSSVLFVSEFKLHSYHTVLTGVLSEYSINPHSLARGEFYKMPYGGGSWQTYHNPYTLYPYSGSYYVPSGYSVSVWSGIPTMLPIDVIHSSDGSVHADNQYAYYVGSSYFVSDGFSNVGVLFDTSTYITSGFFNMSNAIIV